MKHRSGRFPSFFAAVLLLCVLFLLWYIPSVAQRRFQLDDIEKSLETSRGRERKQQYEYDQVVEELPQVRAQLEETLPRTETAEQLVADLKAERKKLRAEKKELESKLNTQAAQEDPGHE